MEDSSEHLSLSFSTFAAHTSQVSAYTVHKREQMVSEAVVIARGSGEFNVSKHGKKAITTPSPEIEMRI